MSVRGGLTSSKIRKNPPSAPTNQLIRPKSFQVLPQVCTNTCGTSSCKTYIRSFQPAKWPWDFPGSFRTFLGSLQPFHPEHNPGSRSRTASTAPLDSVTQKLRPASPLQRSNSAFRSRRIMIGGFYAKKPFAVYDNLIFFFWRGMDSHCGWTEQLKRQFLRTHSGR